MGGLVAGGAVKYPDDFFGFFFNLRDIGALDLSAPPSLRALPKGARRIFFL
jgi:hypothetical protein